MSKHSSNVPPRRPWASHLAAMLTALLLGCATQHDYVPPKANTPPTWVGSKAESARPTDRQSAWTVQSPDNSVWWSGFADAQLSSLIERARQASLDVQASVLRVAESRALRDRLAADGWPTVLANGSYMRQRFSEKTAPALQAGPSRGTTGAAGDAASLSNPFDQYQFAFDASWELDLFGRVRRSIEAADADTIASIEDGRDAVITVQGEVARVYFELRGAQQRRTIGAANLASERDTLALIRARQRAGVGNDLDVARASALVSATEALLPDIDREITQGINQLSLLLALEPGALRTELEGPAPVPTPPLEVRVGLPAELARRRPDIRRAEAQLQAASSRVDVAAADLFPRLTLTAGLGFQAQRLRDLGSWASRFISIGPGIDLPIFDAGRRQATLRLQGLRAQQAALAYRRAVLTALHEVENTLVAYDGEQDRRIALAASAAASRDAVGLANLRYAGGVTAFLDVLDAQRSLQQAELALARSTTVVSIDLVAIYKALGGGWQAEVLSPAGPAGPAADGAKTTKLSAASE